MSYSNKCWNCDRWIKPGYELCYNCFKEESNLSCNKCWVKIREWFSECFKCKNI